MAIDASEALPKEFYHLHPELYQQLANVVLVGYCYREPEQSAVRRSGLRRKPFLVASCETA